MATVVEERTAVATTWWVLSEMGYELAHLATFEAACLVAARERALAAAEARDQAAHQAAKDRDREPDRWPTGRPVLPPAPGSPEYLEADARWTAHLRERTAGVEADVSDLIDCG
jgi:hypothetical protein